MTVERLFIIWEEALWAGATWFPFLFITKQSPSNKDTQQQPEIQKTMLPMYPVEIMPKTKDNRCSLQNVTFERLLIEKSLISCCAKLYPW